jgi:hypothetical protein
MARKVSTRWMETPKEIKAALANNLTSTVAYNRMRKKKLKPLVPLSKLRLMLESKSKRANVPITVNKNLFGKVNADAAAARIAYGNGKKTVAVRVHPITQYYPLKYTSDIVEHELDHVKVIKRTIRNYYKGLRNKRK